MAENINSVVVTGNLTSDPELKYTPSGTAVVKLRVAVNGRQKAPDGTWGDSPNFFNVTVWGKQAEACDKYLSKGNPLAVSGRLDWHEWETDGQKRSAVEIVAERVQFLGGNSGSERTSQASAPGTGNAPPPTGSAAPPAQDDSVPF